MGKNKTAQTRQRTINNIKQSAKQLDYELVLCMN